MIRARIVSTYPADFGLPEENFDFTLELQPDFADNPTQAHERIRRTLARGEAIELPVRGSLTRSGSRRTR